jgi:uncharacterized membrane protein
MVQRFHRRLKDSLRDRWVDHLPWVLLGLRAAAREDYSTTPAQAVFGSPLIFLVNFWIHLSYLQKIFLSNSLRH